MDAQPGQSQNKQLQQVNICYKTMLRKMIRNGFNQTNDFKYIINDKRLHSICKTPTISNFIQVQQTKYLAHIIRQPESIITKQITFEILK